MKVIKPGKPQKGWAKEFKCTGAGNGGGGCGATLLVEQDDLYTTNNTDMSGCTEYFTTFTCSCCGVKTDIQWVTPFPLPTEATWKKRHEKRKS